MSQSSSAPRFFVDLPLTADQTFDLPPETVRHVQVLRLQAGDAIRLFNGDGTVYDARLQTLGKRDVCVHVTGRADEANDGSAAEPPYRIELVQGVASNEKMDWLIEKAVELGVDRITPLLAQRSIVKLSGERAGKRHAHWIALCRAACEQCGRNRVPEVAAPETFERWLTRLEETEKSAAREEGVIEKATGGTPASTVRYLLSPRGAVPFASLPVTPPAGPVQLLIGPEGGWSIEEEAAARAAGFAALSLGPRVLRTETAGMALLAALAGRWGGW